MDPVDKLKTFLDFGQREGDRACGLGVSSFVAFPESIWVSTSIFIFPLDDIPALSRYCCGSLLQRWHRDKKTVFHKKIVDAYNLRKLRTLDAEFLWIFLRS